MHNRTFEKLLADKFTSRYESYEKLILQNLHLHCVVGLVCV